MFTISNREMKDRPKAKKGDLIACHKCGTSHRLEYGKDEAGNETNSLMFYKCGSKSYLAGVDGKLLPPLELIK